MGVTLNAQRIVLTGFSGTGKSTVARLLADGLGWDAMDLDQDIERETGKSIPALFAEEGEARFRDIERAVMLRALDRDRVVIASGGGAVVAEDAWSFDCLSRAGTITIALDAEPSVLLARLQRQTSISGENIERPLLAGANPLAKITELKRTRQNAYDRSDLTLITDRMTADDVAAAITKLIIPGDSPDIQLDANSGSSRVFVRSGIASSVGTLVAKQWPRARRSWIVTDANVGPLHSDRIAKALASSSIQAHVISVPSGESSKSWDVTGRVVGQMLSEGIQRNDVVVALGGGVVGDLAGFAAATVLRGVGIVQIPTSLLAMVDSSVGGKTGINHPVGKNLIGAFYQPALVLIDPSFLRTLPPRELRQSWAEVVKHAIIQPSTPDPLRDDLIRLMERNRRALGTMDGLAMIQLIRRNVVLKASVVEADEREASLRAILNYGHTIGHAIEAAEYRYLHGEAIAVGMHAANRIARLSGRIDSEIEAGLNALIAAFGLPSHASFDPGVVFEKMTSDKKNSGGIQTWVLPRSEGGVELVKGIDPQLVNDALSSVREVKSGEHQTGVEG